MLKPVLLSCLLNQIRRKGFTVKLRKKNIWLEIHWFEKYWDFCPKLELNLNRSFWDIWEVWLMFFNLVNLNFHISAHFKLRIATGSSGNPLRENVLIKFSALFYRLTMFDCCLVFIKEILNLKNGANCIFKYCLQHFIWPLQSSTFHLFCFIILPFAFY